MTRRFVHRTVLEHLVAEHLAGLDAQQAADVLLPHLWFDPDWQVAAPAAIVAHNAHRLNDQQERGLLLQLLLGHVVHAASDPARVTAHREIDRLLLAVAAGSEPDDWPVEAQDVIHADRVRNATQAGAEVALSAHWHRSNGDAREAILAGLTTAASGDVRPLVEVLPALGAADAELAQVRAAVLAALTTR